MTATPRHAMRDASADGSASDRFRAAVDRHMLELVDRHEGAIAAAARRPIEAGGKRLRPLLVLAARPRALEAASHRAQGQGFAVASIHAAAAVELIHTASLVHDDLLDGAQVRRGTPTIGASSGRDVATAAGDLLFSLAFGTLVDCRDVAGDDGVARATRMLARAARTLAEGEAMQARQLRDPTVTERAYLERCAAKTGVLFRAALELGAILGGAAATDVSLLGRFGTLVGVAFQLADDVLDCGPPETEAVLGKRPGADLRDGTITLPMLRAVRRDPALAPILAAPVDDADVEPLLDRIRRAGALESARGTARELRDEAEALLRQLGDRFDEVPLLRVAAASVDRIT